jgi:hypothetical protein
MLGVACRPLVNAPYCSRWEIEVCDFGAVNLKHLRGPLAFSDSRILPFDLGPETFEIRPRRARFQPSGPVETFVFPWRGRRLQPWVGGPSGGPVLGPSGCPGESCKFANSQLHPSNGPLIIVVARELLHLTVLCCLFWVVKNVIVMLA